MGFLDKAKAAANDLAAKADTAFAGSGLGGPGSGSGAQPDRLFRDLGVLAYLETTGREASASERERILGALREAEQRGAVPSFALQTAATAGGAPPPPGGAAAAPPPPGASGTSASSAPPVTPAPPAASDPVPPSAPPPPPPSWS